MISTDSPSCFLVVRGFASFVTEQQLTELFRQFATVKSVHIIRDPQNRTSRGFAYVEFHTIEHAAYALQCSADLKLNNMDLKIAYAKESVMQQLLIQVAAEILVSFHESHSLSLCKGSKCTSNEYSYSFYCESWITKCFGCTSNAGCTMVNE